ncbi:AraC family transcriptional regulator [Paenibacillus sp. J5C_2022]|uniref:AraC family transcriptional regulator n=1 Tax=Paenibacillus sp. J5C2022 TaxID=2977129 RepID=UPI0021D19AB9|nr:AraC family transcriptional regulator [Paenibacillus sp. J5C2022]MCU6711358.1 AraC family transcriptional regulator [Paenibacillus sp. J5C2022]
MKKHVLVTSNGMYLYPGQPVYVNRVTESFRLEQHRHEFTELCYVSEGRGYHYIEDVTIPVAKGDLFYLPEGVSHVFRPSTPVPGEGRLIVYNCIFDQSFAERLIQAYEPDLQLRRLIQSGFPEQSWSRLHDRDGQFQNSFNVMLEEFQRQHANYIPLIQAELIRLLIPFTRLDAASLPPGPLLPIRRRDTDEVMYVIAKRLRVDASNPGSAQQYADEAGLSERHFRRRFKECFDMTFLEYIHKCRIEQSCRLLSSTTAKVTTIAQQVGYRDIKFYNRLFKKLTGMTPNAYRIAHPLNA